MIFIGILSIIILSGLLFVLIYFVLPKMCLRFKYSKTLKEGVMSDNREFYYPDESSSSSIVKYELVKNVNNNKKFAVVTLKDNVNLCSLCAYMFNYKKEVFDYVVVDYLEASNKVIFEVNNKTFGLYIQTISYNDINVNDIENGSTIRLFYSNLIFYSLMVGFSTLIYALLFVFILGYMTSSTNPLYLLANINYGVAILLAILTFVISGIGAFVLTLLYNKKYFKED